MVRSISNINHECPEICNCTPAKLNNRWGILDAFQNEWLLPAEYDNVFYCRDNCFGIVHKGKTGAVRIVDNKLHIIAECEFNTMETIGNNLIFANDTKIRYYNLDNEITRDFKDIKADLPFFYCKDEKYQYILNGCDGKEIYKKSYTFYNEASFCFCGNTKEGPVFCDVRHFGLLYPCNGEFITYNGVVCESVDVCRDNVINITQGENGIGAVDCFGRKLLDDVYDCIELELKIIAAKGTDKKQSTVPLRKLSFQK